MKKLVTVISLVGSLCVGCGALAKPETNTDTAARAEYWEVVSKRAQKIVDTLELDDAEKAGRVRDVIAGQYQALNDIHEARDAAIEAAGEAAGENAGLVAEAVESIRRQSRIQVMERHYKFLALLAVDLSPSQIDQVKDGLTYGVVPITYRRYQQLFPDLEDEHMAYIYSALIEAREFAMDEGSSKAKHHRFGKYKGRINNYVSALGVDIREAERVLAEKEKALKK